MKIIYNKNPLRSHVILEDYEKEIFKLKLEIEQYEWAVLGAHMELKGDFDHMREEKTRGMTKEQLLEGKVKNAIQELKGVYRDEDQEKENKHQQWWNSYVDGYLGSLLDIHSGDCTCVPCSCEKCHAESILGIDTMPGLRKHQTYKIDNAFGKNNERTIDEAIVYLENYDAKITPGSWGEEDPEGWNKAAPRWIEEARQACAWLKQYKQVVFDQDVVFSGKLRYIDGVLQHDSK